MTIAILVDNINSWFVPFSHLLKESLQSHDIVVSEYYNSEDVGCEDICFILSCTKILKRSFLEKHKHNIVVHASDLPKGKGWTPLKWQILEGKNLIPLTLFEAIEECDAGPYYFKDTVIFSGYELLDEMQSILGKKIIEMCCRFVKHLSEMSPISQSGESTYYRRFCNSDDMIDANLSINDAFQRFRIADFDRFPLYFDKNGHKYSIVVKRIN